MRIYLLIQRCTSQNRKCNHVREKESFYQTNKYKQNTCRAVDVPNYRSKVEVDAKTQYIFQYFCYGYSLVVKLSLTAIL